MTFTGRCFKMTWKTRLFLWFHEKFNDIAQWFINHCETEPCDYFQITQTLIEDSQFELIDVEREG